jgi:hypothetical protein
MPVHTTNYSAADAVTALGSNHGYCLDGDFVHLNADLSLAEADLADGTHWALQLWASPSGFDGLSLNGVKVAELALQPTPGHFNVAACVTALPPAGCAAQVMAMALVGQRIDGSTQVRELSVYPTPQTFFQPFILGNVSCQLADGKAEIAIESIASPRSADNLSGTLALEVWALDAPYAGGAWRGQPVASLVLGQLSGGSAWTDCHYNVPAVAAGAGAALTLMLREWTPAGYLTRDYRNLSVPVPVPAAVAVAVAEPVVAVVKPAKAEKKVAKKSASKASAKPAAEKAETVSVNSASVAELAAVKGVSKAVAEAIVAARPYAKLDDLVRAKGVGAKLLEKIGKFLKV